MDTEYNLTQEEITKAKSIEITAFGDSIILNVFEDLQNIFPKMIVDGDIGRQLYTSIPLITKLDEEELLKQTVLVALGTNGSFTSNQFDDFMSSIGPNRKVYWVNVRVPTKEWQNDVNVMLENKKKKYSNLTVIDWYSYSNKHDDWFYEDRVHPNIDGQAKFSSFIAKKILETD